MVAVGFGFQHNVTREVSYEGGRESLRAKTAAPPGEFWMGTVRVALTASMVLT